ncbi:response regulator transcription factor [Nesterenkonia rhizosphaerae]|uniref:Response regulator n=1 Tax=Nesterenkonia rhizosphaerae TaxID=1348272 RepID=A0ABP9FXM7_9MICC
MPQERRALVIEDDDDIRRLLEMVLGQAGFTVDTVSSGEEGVAWAAREDYVLATVDIGLPDIDGLEVIRRIRSTFTGRIVVISARASTGDETHGMAAGADLYLTKPFRPRELRAHFEGLLSAKPAP